MSQLVSIVLKSSYLGQWDVNLITVIEHYRYGWDESTPMYRKHYSKSNIFRFFFLGGGGNLTVIGEVIIFL